MGISSHKPDRAAIRAELEKYFTPEACCVEGCTDPLHPDEDQKIFESIADKLFKVTYERIQQREMWLLLYQPQPGLPMAMTGWFSSQNEAEKGATAIVGGSAQAVKVIPFGHLKALAESDHQEFQRLFGEVECADCGHQEWMHGAQGFKKGGGQGSVTPPARNRCQMNCQCKAYRDS